MTDNTTPQRIAVTVKPLEWVKVSDTDYCAKKHDARITSNGVGWGLSLRDWPHFGDYPYPTLEAAMQAEQGFYETHILSVIDTKPAHEVRQAALREAARKVICDDWSDPLELYENILALIDKEPKNGN